MFEHISEGVYFRASRSFDSNITLVRSGNRAVLIDTGTGMNQHSLEQDLSGIGCSIDEISDIVLTHSHIDHVGGVPLLLEHTSANVHLHQSEGEMINSGNMRLTLSDNFGVAMSTFKVDNLLTEGEMLRFGDIHFKVYHTPGHSIGSVCLHEESLGIMVTGDLLFPGGSFGRVDLPSGSPEQLVDSLGRISDMDFNIILPGHMNAVLNNAKRSAILSYQMASQMFMG